jgi:hypothetical protein
MKPTLVQTKRRKRRKSMRGTIRLQAKLRRNKKQDLAVTIFLTNQKRKKIKTQIFRLSSKNRLSTKLQAFSQQRSWMGFGA